MSPLQAVVVALWFGTGSPCLLTLELPLDGGLQMALYKEHECPLIWSWQRDRAGPGLLSLQNTPHIDIASSLSLLALQVHDSEKGEPGGPLLGGAPKRGCRFWRLLFSLTEGWPLAAIRGLVGFLYLWHWSRPLSASVSLRTLPTPAQCGWLCVPGLWHA